MLILEGQGDLPGVPPAERESWSGYLAGCQSAKSGLFEDPLSPAVSSPHSSESGDLRAWIVSLLAIEALDALGAPAPYPLRFMDAWSDQAVAVAWLDSLDWKNSALQAERLRCALAFLVYRTEVEQRSEAIALFHTVLDWLDRAQDRQTGLWGASDVAEVTESVAAVCCLVPFYEYVQRPLTRASAELSTPCWAFSRPTARGRAAGATGHGASSAGWTRWWH